MTDVTLSKAIIIATFAHEGQLDKAGLPYILHPMRVAASYRLTSEVERAAAMLHDVIEDTRITPEGLSERGIPAEVIDLVLILTRKPHPIETYATYIERVSLSEGATRIKLADLDDNTSPTRATAMPASMMTKYARTYKTLEEEKDG